MMKVISYLSFLSFLMLMLSCQKEEITIANEYKLDLGQTLSFDQGVLEVQFTEVNDSRCPIDVLCAWAGEARVTFTITNGVVEREEVLILESEEEIIISSSQYGDHKLKLLEVNPYPTTTDPFPVVEKDILFTLTKS